MKIMIHKASRTLEVWNNAKPLLRFPIALGQNPIGHKYLEGDGRTPQGIYRICLTKKKGKYGPSLGISYPGEQDAQNALTEGRIDAKTCQAILQAHQDGKRPPWGTPLGGEIYLHGGGSTSDWTQGCIALSDEDMETLFSIRHALNEVEILP